MLLRTATASLIALLLSVTACTDHSSFGQNVAGAPPGSIDPTGGSGAPLPSDGTAPTDTVPSDSGGIPPVEEGGAALPEPGTMLLVGSGLAGMAFYRRRQRRRDPA